MNDNTWKRWSPHQELGLLRHESILHLFVCLHRCHLLLQHLHHLLVGSDLLLLLLLLPQCLSADVLVPQLRVHRVIHSLLLLSSLLLGHLLEALVGNLVLEPLAQDAPQLLTLAPGAHTWSTRSGGGQLWGGEDVAKWWSGTVSDSQVRSVLVSIQS